MHKKNRTSSALSDAVKSSIVYILSSLFTNGLTAITLPLFTRLMPPSKIGIVNLFNSWCSMIGVVATLALASGGFQLALKEFKGKRNQYISSILSLTSLVAVVMGILYLIKPSFWNNLTGLSTGLMILMIIYFLLNPAKEFWMLRERYEYKYKAVAAVSFLSAFFASALSLLAVLLANKSGYENLGEIRLYANYAVLLSVAIVIWIMTFVKGKILYNKRFWIYSLSLSIPLIGNSIASQILSVSDRTMINKMVGIKEVGIYGTLYTISSISLIVWGAINSSFIPFLYENMDNPEKKKYIKNLSSRLLAFFAVVAFLLTIMAPEIVRILATKEYYDAIYIMPPIAAGVFMTSISNMYSNILIYHRKTQFIMVSSIIAAITNVVLNFFGIKMFSYMAAAYTTLISYVVLGLIQGVIAIIIHKKITGDRDDEVYDTKILVILSIGTIFACISCLLLYKFIIIRYIIVTVISIVIIGNFKKIMKLLSKKNIKRSLI